MKSCADVGVAERRGHGSALIVIHGNGVDHRNLLPLDGHLAAGGFERIYLDLPGFGRTAPLPGAGTLPDYAHWLQERVAALVRGERFALFGQSMGALLAQEVADRFAPQVLGLGLLAPVIFPAHGQRTLPPRRILHEDPAWRAGVDDVDQAWYEELSVLRDPRNFERFGQHVLPGIRGANLRAMARLAQGYDLPVLPVRRTENWPFPVLAVCGREDHVTGFRDAALLHHRAADFSQVLIERAGHNLHIDQPRQAGQAVRDWAHAVQRFTAGRAGQDS